MIQIRNIPGLLLVMALSVFFLFGDVTSFFWARYDLIIQSLIVIYIIKLSSRKTRDKQRDIILSIFLGVAVFKLLLGFYSLIDADVFNKINRSFWIGGIMIVTIMIFLRYRIYGLVKRKTRATMDA